MVAAEAAASGVPPVVAAHSGLATIARALERHYPAEARALTAFESGDASDLCRVLARILELSPAGRQRLSSAAREAAEAYWSWQSIAERLIEGVPSRS